jgi:hypothetical protein
MVPPPPKHRLVQLINNDSKPWSSDSSFLHEPILRLELQDSLSALSGVFAPPFTFSETGSGFPGKDEQKNGPKSDGVTRLDLSQRKIVG